MTPALCGCGSAELVYACTECVTQAHAQHFNTIVSRWEPVLESATLQVELREKDHALQVQVDAFEPIVRNRPFDAPRAICSCTCRMHVHARMCMRRESLLCEWRRR